MIFLGVLLCLLDLNTQTLAQWVIPSQSSQWLSAWDSIQQTSSSSNLSATITTGPVPTGGSAGCPRCLVVASGVPISRVFWINSTLGLTLDTEYVTVTQYNGSAVTSTTLVTGNVDTIDPATVSEAYSMALSIPMPDPYGGIGGPGVVLANGRDGKINDAVSIPYPNPYIGIAGIQVWTQTLLSQTSQGSVVQNCPLKTFNILAGGYQDDSLSCIQLEFSSTYYEVLTHLSAQPWSSTIVEIDVASFSNYVMANQSLVSQYPGLSHCTFIAPAFGPPGVKIPVSALTGTTTTTVQGSMYSSTLRPQPASTLISTTAQQTSSPKSPLPIEISSSIQSPSSATLPNSANPESNAQASQDSPESTLSPSTTTDETQYTSTPSTIIDETQSTSTPSTIIDETKSTSTTLTSELQSSHVHTQFASFSLESSTFKSDAVSAIVVAGHTLSREASAVIEGSTPVSFATAGEKTIIGSSVNMQAEPSSATKLRVPVLTYGGSPYTADVSSHFVLSDQTLVPGSAITISGTLVSLASDASNAVVGSNVEELTDIDIIPTAVRTTGGAIYQIAGQTLTPGGTVTVSGTPVHIPSGASVAVIGSSTYILAPATSTAVVPTATYREITFGDQTYTASGSTPEFIIAGQTLTPKGAVTVSGTPIHIPSGASVVVVGSSTQAIATVIATSPTDVATVGEITFGGQTYTADTASQFRIEGQTLTPGGVVTVDGTQVSYAPEATDVVVGSSTEPVNLGTVIMGGFGQPSQTGSEPFTGASNSNIHQRMWCWIVLTVCIALAFC